VGVEHCIKPHLLIGVIAVGTHFPTEEVVMSLNEANLNKLLSLLGLHHGWDGLIAPPPSAEAVGIGMAALYKAGQLGIRIDRVAADVEGGVAIYHFDGEVTAGLLIKNDQSIMQYVRDPRKMEHAEVNEVEATAEGMARAWEGIRDVLASGNVTKG
jgi:hypothetical protein